MLLVASIAVPAYGAGGLDADTVDGRDAVGCRKSIEKRAGKLVATCANGRLPNNIILVAPNSKKLQGKTLAEVIAAAEADLNCTGCVGALELDVAAAPGNGQVLSFDQGSLVWRDLGGISSVTGGTGITGGGSVGDVVLALAPAYPLPQGCGAGEIPKWNATSMWTCAGDTNTTYGAGTGLDLSGTTFSVDTAEIQARVSGSCAVGSAIRAIASDGTVTCETPAGSGELILIQRGDFDHTATYLNTTVDWETVTTGGGTVTLTTDESLIELNTPGSPSTAVLRGRRSASVTTGTLIFTARVVDAYAEACCLYGDSQPRGLANGTDRTNAIEFINALPGPNRVSCRTVSGGVATVTTVDIGQSVRQPAVYQIVADATEVNFYVNGALVCTHTTNIPTAALNIYFGTGDSGAGFVPHTIDWVTFERRV